MEEVLKIYLDNDKKQDERIKIMGIKFSLYNSCYPKALF